MAFSLVYHPDVKAQDLPSINRDVQRRIARAIELRLVTAPDRYGEPLRKTLKGYWKFRVGDYRVVYKMVGSEVRVLAILHRSEVYERAAKRVILS